MEEILSIFKKEGALLRGHFLLSSGLHSDQYLQCALVLQYPRHAESLGRSIADNFRGKGITCVAGPATGGIIIAHEVAKSLGARCVFGERENGKMTLRRGFNINPDNKILIVEDVITTGGSIKELIDVVKKSGAGIEGVAAIVDRSGGKFQAGYETKALITLDIKTYTPDKCSLCKNNIPVVKPGSRNRQGE